MAKRPPQGSHSITDAFRFRQRAFLPGLRLLHTCTRHFAYVRSPYDSHRTFGSAIEMSALENYSFKSVSCAAKSKTDAAKQFLFVMANDNDLDQDAQQFSALRSETSALLPNVRFG